MDFPARFRELRIKKGLSQTELGKLFNLSKQTISSYENGRSSPDPDQLDQFATFFDVSVDYLLGRTNIRKFDLDIDNIAAMRSREMEGYNDLTKEEQEFLRNFVREYYERFGKKKESE